MPELANTELVESLAAALDAMAFVTLDAAEEPFSPPEEPVLVRIGFRGPHRGRVELIVPRALGRLLLDNTLGADPSDTLVMPNPADALVELANVTCGSLLKRLPGGAACEMSVPEAMEFDANAAGAWEAFTTTADVMLAEGLVVAIRVVEA